MEQIGQLQASNMNYWKVKAQLFQVKILEERINNLMSKMDDLRARTYKEAGLEITKSYNFDDEKETITEIPDATQARTPNN